MGRDRAAYMREYRARKRPRMTLDEMIQANDLAVAKDAIVRALEEEVRHLKAELAKRPTLPEVGPANAVQAAIEGSVVRTFNSRPFTPVPKRRSRSPR